MKFSATCVSAALALVIAGCPVTNTPPTDATGADAWSPELSTDAARFDAGVDAFVCLDLDGDGETDAACGGLDCADGDATLTSTVGPCGTPTAIRRCVSGMLTDVECTGDTPYCDARLGECVANACGDGVVHSNELCDSTDSVCRSCRPRCSTLDHCEVGQVCRLEFEPSGSAFGACARANPSGAADGTPCARDDECYSTRCDSEMRRCSSESLEMCEGPDSWIEDDLLFSSAVLRRPGGFRCRYSCQHGSECGPDAECVLSVVNVPRYLLATCVNVRRGTVEFGESCDDDADCRGVLCANHRCTRVCRDDGDCSTSLPACREVDLRDEPGDLWRLPQPRPSDWETAWPRLCAP